jgi:adenine-specific DNA-methyltransferase
VTQNYDKLKELLKELFQLDQPELDFGLYRVMHAKSAEVSQFLDKDLLPQVQAAFAQYQSADKSEIEKDLATVIANLKGAGVDPEQAPKVQELRARLQGEAVDLAGLESEVYDLLFGFFRRYYSEGDFLAKRVYKPGVYAIPYEGEEVTLYWANKDQYYIKTSEYLRDYAFRLRPDDDKNPMRVHFQLADAVEGEHGDVKAAEGKERRFKLTDENAVSLENGELVVRFTYEPDPARQKELNTAAEQAVLATKDNDLLPWLTELGKSDLRGDGTSSGTRLRLHLDRYTARNTFDYFIHKDLGRFLRRELDFYLKNEVMHLDDVANESAPRAEQYLSKLRVIRTIAGKIIDFLAQLEDFQKKLWLKKKFVVETQYCITLDRIPEAFYADIVANDAQRDEWVKLFAFDELPGYSKKLKVEFLKAHPTLVVDTRHFDSEFTSRLLDALGELNEQTDGLLFHAENFQALSLMQARYQERIDCIYIDPPYNTGDSEISYKNGYLRASWLTLMANRVGAATPLMSSDGVLYVAIDDFEMVDLAKLVDTEYPSLRREMIVVNHHPQGGKAKTLAQTHEYMLACVPSSSNKTLVGRTTDRSVEQRPFRRSGTAESNFRYGRPNSFYALLVDPKSRKVTAVEAPPTLEGAYPKGPTKAGLIRVYPIAANGDERVWRRSFESCLELVAQGKLMCTEENTIYQLIEADERTTALFSNWVNPRYNAGTFGANLLRDIVGEQNAFSYPKSIYTVEDAIFATGLEDGGQVLDFFAGSGTTGHAVISLNRDSDIQSSFILVEMGDYFDTVLVPRIKKVTFAPEWKEGKPTRLCTPEEAARSPRVLKILRLESYEDTLNNLETRRTSSQQTLLDAPHAQGADRLKEQYILRYMLDVETRGSQSLLNVQAFTDPTAYKLKVKRPGSDESTEMNVDLLETFNWLIGLTVQHIAAPQAFAAAFERDGEKRLRLNGRLKQEGAGSYWFRTVTGTTPEGQRALIIWRKLTGDVEQDNVVLDEWFTKQGYSAKDSEFDLIYVNGDNNLENLKTNDDLWKVRLIEHDFQRLMFEMGPA